MPNQPFWRATVGIEKAIRCSDNFRFEKIQFIAICEHSIGLVGMNPQPCEQGKDRIIETALSGFQTQDLACVHVSLGLALIEGANLPGDRKHVFTGTAWQQPDDKNGL